LSGSASRSQETGNAKSTVGSGFLGTGTRASVGSPFSETRESVVAFYEMKPGHTLLGICSIANVQPICDFPLKFLRAFALI
jgi:hypothetical protein